MLTISRKTEIFIILIALSIAMGTYRMMIHYNKDNPIFLNIIDLDLTRNNIKNILILQKEYLFKYNYNYNFYRG